MAAAVALFLVALIIGNKRTPILDITSAKGMALPAEAFVQWNSFSRISVTEGAGADPLIIIDADATTGIPRFDLDHLTEAQKRAFALFDNKIGLDSGWDLEKVSLNVAKIVELDINPLVATAGGPVALDARIVIHCAKSSK